MRIRENNLINALLLGISIAILFFIPFKILSFGYLPYDDVLRHAAKVISQKKWHEILMVRGDMFLDSHPGWEFILNQIHRYFNFNGEHLVSFSIVSLFLFFIFFPVIFIKRIESYLLALILILTSFPSFGSRIFIGRPLIVSMVFIVFWGLNIEKFKDLKKNKKSLLFLFLLTFICSWIHCQWYFFFFPVVGFLLTGRLKSFFTLSVLLITAIFSAFLITGYPFEMFKQTTYHLVRSVISPLSQDFLVPEFKSVFGDFNTMILLLIVIIIKLIKDNNYLEKIKDDPFLILIFIYWILGQKVNRFWLDWGIPSSLAWITLQLDSLIFVSYSNKSLKRYVMLLIISISLFLILTSDVNLRWSQSANVKYLTMKEPIPKEWLPGKNGIIYNDMTSAFNWTFFKYPKGDWKYILGFEASLMIEEDLKILHDIQNNPGKPEYYLPWLRKMKKSDRLFLVQYYYSKPPDFFNVEWYLAPENTWIGRIKADN